MSTHMQIYTRANTLYLRIKLKARSAIEWMKEISYLHKLLEQLPRPRGAGKSLEY